MASPQPRLAKRPAYSPPPTDGDFYKIASVLNDTERALIKRVREFTEGVVAPVIEDYWARDEFPFEIIPKIADVGIGGVGYDGYGAAGGSWLLNGVVAMELARAAARSPKITPWLEAARDMKRTTTRVPTPSVPTVPEVTGWQRLQNVVLCCWDTGQLACVPVVPSTTAAG